MAATLKGRQQQPQGAALTMNHCFDIGEDLLKNLPTRFQICTHF
jgi:hypothetical protein